jgi:hypothetical protein
MMFGWGHSYYFGGWMVGMMLFGVLVIVGIVYLIVYFTRTSRK